MSAFIRPVDNQFDARPIRVVAERKGRSGKGRKGALFSSRLSYQSDYAECGSWEGLSVDDVKDILLYYEGKTLAELRRLAGDSFFSMGEERTDLETSNYENLILYRLHFWQDDETVDGAESSDKNRFSFQVETSNLMGVVRLPHPKDPEKALRMEILSRFDKSGNQVFLNYLLAYVYGFDLIDSVEAGTTEFLRVLVSVMFVRRLGESVQVGIYRQYREYACNDLDFEGVLDLDRHLAENCPLWDRIAYCKRVINTDVPLNHLLRYALERIRQSWPQVLDADENAREQARLIIENTPTWGREDVERVIGARECCMSVRHPYFCEYYEELRLLARMILDGEGFGVYDAEEKDEVAGVLFDGAWLWEEYLSTVLENVGYEHSRVGSGNGFAIFSRPEFSRYRMMYPDFYRRNSEGRVESVLDAKYKSGVVEPGDVQELLSYAMITGASRVGLIFPPSVNEGRDTSSDVNAGILGHALSFEAFRYEPWDAERDSIEDYMQKQEVRLLQNYRRLA